MKKFKKTIGQLSKMAIGLALLGALYTTHASAQTLNVDLMINDDQTEITPQSRGNCTNGNHPGCVQTTKASHADINFHLKNEYTDCNRAPGAKWELSAVILGGKNSPTKPASWGTLDAEVTADFDFADAASGLLKVENGSNGRKLSISDKNQYAYDIWYTVEAECVGTDGAILDTLKVDPRVSNVGQ